MRIIFSRKGFDSGSGGGASPILPDGRIISLPIPDYRGTTTYGDLTSGEDVAKLVADLSNGRYRSHHKAHLDPDLDATTLPRAAGWRGAFGQTGAAASHLIKQGVGPGDLFLFFGWFRDVELKDGRWRYLPKGRSIHALFGWLQIADIVSLASGDPQDWQADYPWLRDHPHTKRGPEPLNHVFVGTEKLTGVPHLTGFPGYGLLPSISERLTLTKSGNANRSVWTVPAWVGETSTSLSYHGDASRWQRTPSGFDLKVVGRGQEFVLSGADHIKSSEYLRNLFDGTVHASSGV